jgi:hypothetical protein
VVGQAIAAHMAQIENSPGSSGLDCSHQVSTEL